MHSARKSVGILLAGLLFAVWGSKPLVAGPNDEILVAAASDLQGVLPEIIREYVREHAQKVAVTFGASGKLAEQIRAGAGFHLFLAANEAFVKKLADENLIKRESIQPYAIGSLVLVIRHDATIPVKTLADLLKPEIKTIALANPDLAPYGFAARQALKKAGLWEKVEPKLVQADSVRQAFQFVETGNADVGLVSQSLTRGSQVKVVAVDPALHDPIVQSLGVVTPTKGGVNPETFARFLTGPKGRSILKSHGFNLPPAVSP